MNGFAYFAAEYNSIDKELDQLNSCLDTLENWNDSLHSRMKEFLETMKEKKEDKGIKPQENQEMEVDKWS